MTKGIKMSSIAVLQARTNSSRLPGKVLLPLGALPTVVLAARRAANAGRKVIVATSNEYTDDALVDLLNEYGVENFRGSLNNTLKRITDALINYSDDTLVFRLTADNVFPDGPFLDEMEKYFIANQLRYLTSNSLGSGLPYGVSVELMYLSDLRSSFELTDDAYDQEHVTPFIRRKYGESTFDQYSSVNMSHYRATIDCFDDYIAIQRVFKNVSNPENIPLSELMVRLKDAPFQPESKSPISKLVLGTVQLGLNYGINNTAGQPDQNTAIDLIKLAIVNGVKVLDTARAYGNSEKVIGKALQKGWHSRCNVITKLDPLNACPIDATPEIVSAFVNASVFRSCTELNTQVIDVLMLHREHHRKAWNSAAWKALKELVDNNVIKALGVSIQSPEELISCLNDPLVEYIQLPFNILDWRWDDLIPVIKAEKLKRKLVIHTRSSFLQGLLMSDDVKVWNKVGVDKPESIIKWLNDARSLVNEDKLEYLFLGYCLSQDWIDGVVIGIETEDQLRSNLHVADNSIYSKEDFQSIINSRPKINANVLNPSTWNT